MPSPQLSQDDLITHLAVFNAKENSTTAPDSPTSSSGLQSPVAYQLSKDQMVPEGIKDDDQTESGNGCIQCSIYCKELIINNPCRYCFDALHGIHGPYSLEDPRP